MTDVPVGSRTTVQERTQEGLTSGFGMRPGILLRYDRAPNFSRIGYATESLALLINR